MKGGGGYFLPYETFIASLSNIYFKLQTKVRKSRNGKAKGVRYGINLRIISLSALKTEVPSRDLFGWVQPDPNLKILVNVTLKPQL